jgi:alpha-tubulin suppressor-like RCC1 family protein
MSINYTFTQSDGRKADFDDVFVRREFFSDGSLWTWGDNYFGYLGDGTTTSRSSPGTTAGGGTNWKQVSGNYRQTAAIKTDGTLWTCGYNGKGELGDGTTTDRSSPGTTAGGGTNWKQVSAGYNHTAAIKTDGTLWTCGYNLQGQLGDGTTTDLSSPGTTAGGGTNWKQVDCGAGYTAAIKTDGTLWTWGANSSGQLGDGTTSNRSSPGTTAGGGTNWKQVSAGELHTAAIKTDGTLWGWGLNDSGQLGIDPFKYRGSPVTTARGGNDWAQVSCGYRNSAGITVYGELWVWGCYSGSGSLDYVFSPVTVAGGGTNWAQVSCGDDHTAAIKTDGTLWTWGVNTSGKLGDGTTTSRLSPGTTAGGGTNWAQVSTAYGFYTAAIKTDGTLWTWGANDYGQLGDGTTTSRRSPGTTAGGGTNWAQVSCGYNHTAAIKTDGTLWTWGVNTSGKLGDGTTTSRSSPGTTAGGGTNWAQVSCGVDHTAAIKTDGTLWTWGRNDYGQLGDGTTTSRSSPGTTAGGGTNWAQVSFVSDGTIAIKTDGTLWTWGYDPDNSSHWSPVTTFGGDTDWDQVSIGFTTGGYVAPGDVPGAAAIKTDGTLWIWGDNSIYGRLGIGETVLSLLSPATAFGGGTNWKQVDCGGGAHTAAIKTDGTLWSCGYNGSGQLGDGTTTMRSSPVTTAGGGTNWKQVEGGDDHTAAIKTDGTLWTWGYNYYGQLGDGTTTDRSSPGTIAGGGTNWKQVSAGYNHTAVIKDITLF